MNVNTKIIKEQMEIIINDFFIDKLINKNHRDNDLDLNSYLTEEIHNLENVLNISFKDEEIQESFIKLCEELNILKNISKIKDISKKITIDIIENKISISQETCDLLSKNIVDSYEDGFNINKLYKPVEFTDKYNSIKKILNDDIFNYLQTNSKWQEKEAIGTINTFLEASNFTEEDIKKMYKKSGSNKDFIKQLATEINKSSLISSPFNIDKNKITFSGKGSGLYDFFMYSDKSKMFALNFSTRSTGTKIDGESIYRHTLSALSILYQYSKNKNLAKRNLKKTDFIFQHLYDHFAHYSKPSSYGEGATSKIKNKLEKENGISKFKYQDQCIKGVNKRLPIALSETMKMINPESVEVLDVNNSDSKLLHELSKELHKDELNVVRLDETDITKLFDSVDFNFNIFYFGEVASSKNDSKLTNHFTNEELRAGLNALAYSGRNMSGIGGIKLSAKATLNIIERINYRFNTSTRSNNNCLDINKLNSNIRNIGGIFINKFMLNKNPLSLIQEIYDKESNQVLENMSFFEKNVLQQIIDGIIFEDKTPNQSYALTLGQFNLKPELDFNEFIYNLEKKWDLLSNEKIDNGNSLMIKQLKFIIKSRNLELKNIEIIESMEAQMLNQIDKFLNNGFIEKDIIADKYFTSEILIKKFGVEKVKKYRNLEIDEIEKYEINKKINESIKKK